eukprot:9765856-Prorocentrum_lima.AAC.1
MTSSLVGSEMCIRDSKATVAASQARSPRMARTTSSLGVADRRGTSLIPVSYTHLTLPTICSV